MTDITVKSNVEAVVFVESNYMQVIIILSQHNTINFIYFFWGGGGIRTVNF